MNQKPTPKPPKTHGGKRPGSGRPKDLPESKKSSYSVRLTAKDRDLLILAHGNLTKAIRKALNQNHNV